MQVSRHHLLSERTLWEARKETRIIRRMGGNIVRMAVEPHKDLHDNVSGVPVPNIYMARYMLANFEPQGNIFKNIDELCFVVESSTDNDRANDLDKQLGSLIIDTLQAQIPFIKSGMVHAN